MLSQFNLAEGKSAINLLKLRIFHVVARERSFRRAAELMHIAQPAVSRHIRDLEEMYGLNLLERRGRMVTLTEAGRVVFEFAEETLRSAAEVDTLVAELKTGLTGRVAVGVSPPFGNYIMPELLAEFCRAHPWATVEIRVGTTNDLCPQIMSGNLDFGVGMDVPMAGLEHRFCYESTLVAVASPRFPLPDGEVTPEAFANLPYVAGFGQLLSSDIERQLHIAGYPMPRIVARSSEIETIKHLVQAGVGISILASETVTHALASGALRALPLRGVHLTARYALLHRTRRRFAPAVAALMDRILEQAQRRVPPAAQ